MNPFTHIVVYRTRCGSTDLKEYTSNVTATVAMLVAQGCIIIDVIDIG